jgi:predicted short-subunit dehydrogenase-like oxidoreductase (DUF2520 family)
MSEDVDTRPWVIVGCGRMGRALGWLAHRYDVPLRATWNRTQTTADALPDAFEARHRTWGTLETAMASIELEDAIVWLTVADDALDDVASMLAEPVPAETPVIHASGSRPASILTDAGLAGPVGSLHPLLAITDPHRAADEMGEVTWTVEGDDVVVRYATSLIEGRLGARIVELETGQRALYHASAATAANLLIGLLEAAFAMADEAGIDRDDARAMLLPLVASSLDNASNEPLESALSGPLARGDETTVRRHLDALEDLDDEDLGEVYRTLTDWTRQRLGSDDDT